MAVREADLLGEGLGYLAPVVEGEGGVLLVVAFYVGPPHGHQVPLQVAREPVNKPAEHQKRGRQPRHVVKHRLIAIHQEKQVADHHDWHMVQLLAVLLEVIREGLELGAQGRWIAELLLLEEGAAVEAYFYLAFEGMLWLW